jgi:hypothetical protein
MFDFSVVEWDIGFLSSMFLREVFSYLVIFPRSREGMSYFV